MAPDHLPAAQHVPAWKQLGLKLKYAKDEPITKSNVAAVPVPELKKKRKAVDRESVKGDAATPAKKVKNIQNARLDPLNISVIGIDRKNENLTSLTTPQIQSGNSEKSSSSALKIPVVTKRKSVTFAPEAKITDGDSTKDLYNQWLSSQAADDTTFNAKTAIPALQYHSPLLSSKTATNPPSTSETINGQSQKQKKKKKKKRKTKSKSTTIKPGQIITSRTPTQPSLAEPNEYEPHPALVYLTDYHDSPSTWKFSKNHQKYLLKNLFTLEKFPSSYDPAFHAYLSGLKGLSARQAIRDVALKVREEDEMWLSDIIAKGRVGEWEKKRKREEYEAAWKRERERLEDVEDDREWEEGREEFEWRLKKRRRAEVVLGAVGEVETQGPHGGKADKGETTMRMGTGGIVVAGNAQGEISADGGPKQPQTKKRKRKRRTTGVPDDDESSSSSSSSDSDSEDEKAKMCRKALDESNMRDKSTPSSGLGVSATQGDEDGTSNEDNESSSEDSDEEEEDESGTVSDSSDEEESHSSSSDSGSD